MASAGLVITHNSDKARFVVVDAQNNPKALGQYLKGIAKASDINSRLGNLVGQVPKTDLVLDGKISPADLDSLLQNSQHQIETNFVQRSTLKKPAFDNVQRRRRKTKFFKKLLKQGFQSDNVETIKIDTIYRINICDPLGKMYLHLKCGSIVCNSFDRVELLGKLNRKAVSMMAECSQVNGWKSAHIWGSNDFKIMITQEYLRRGIPVTNFELSPEQLSKFINEISSPDEVVTVLATHFQMDENNISDFINSQPENLLHELKELKEKGISIQDHLQKNCESYQREKIRHFVLTGEIDEHLTDETKAILQEAKSHSGEMEFLQGCIPFIHMDKWNELEGVAICTCLYTGSLVSFFRDYKSQQSHGSVCAPLCFEVKQLVPSWYAAQIGVDGLLSRNETGFC